MTYIPRKVSYYKPTHRANVSSTAPAAGRIDYRRQVGTHRANVAPTS